MQSYISIWPVIGLALIHLFGTRLAIWQGMPRSIWLSGAGGVSVSYIFLHLFPELQEGQLLVEKQIDTLGFLKHHIYLLALIGLVVFYGLERAVVKAKDRDQYGKEGETPPGAFWLHIISFAIYNFLIGYSLLQREKESLRSMMLFAIAMALHFIVNDYGLHEKHHDKYQRIGRIVLVGSLVAGWVLGLVYQPTESAVMMIMAFIAGGVILNVLKEELPEQRKSRYEAFLFGAVAYSILLLAV